MYDIKDETPLHKAVDWGNLHVVYYLLRHGANPNTVNIYGQTPLSAAHSRGYIWINWLLKIYNASVKLIRMNIYRVKEMHNNSKNIINILS